MIKYGQYSVPAFLLLSVLLAASCVLFGCNATSSLSCSVPERGESDGGSIAALSSLKLKALSPAARKGLITGDSTTAWFSFDPEEFSAVISRDPLLDAIEVAVTSSVPVDILLAPVFPDDLTKQGRLVSAPATRSNALVTGVSGAVTIRMRMISPGKAGQLAGFAVEALPSTSVAIESSSAAGGTELYAQIDTISLVSGETGWETMDGGYWTGFGLEGGSHIYGQKAPVLLDRNERAVFKFAASGADLGTPVRPHRSVFTADSVTFGWLGSPIAHTTYVYAEQLETVPVLVKPETGTELLTGIRVTPSSILQEGTNTPISLDPHAMITWPQNAWRNPEREIFSWDRFPSILIFDTADYAVQARYFKRLAFFVEKAGYIGQLLSDRDIAPLHGYNAHDYQAENLAVFFDRAKRENFPLNRHEMELRDILVKNGIIIAAEDGYLPGTGSVLSFSRQSVTYLRYLFMAHEGFHGLYFTDEPFRQNMHRFYTTMDRRAVEFLETYFSVVDTLGYDQNDRFLMENECMAYTLQQPLHRVSDYFSGTIRDRFIRHGGPDELADYMEKSAAKDFYVLGKNLEQYVFSRWGLASGRVGLWYYRQD